jgi:hypothetical protein
LPLVLLHSVSPGLDMAWCRDLGLAKSDLETVLIFEIVGNAKLEGLTTDLHITGNQYLFTLTIYFIGYVS